MSKEVKKGYKQTEAGSIPGDWDIKNLVILQLYTPEGKAKVQVEANVLA
ncbi:hypothetical protein KJ693_11590 [bacterium]|nr:hypothetical protein [bacterium]MBU1615933.1 hypothetical protein [bacterium]